MTKIHALMRIKLQDIPARIYFFFGIILLISEIWKQLTLTFCLGNGSYNWWYFPFQLCSLPMYILIAYPWVSLHIRRIFSAYLMSFSLMSGIAVFADTSGLHYPIAALTFHSYAWHILLILLGIFSGISCLFQEFRNPAEPSGASASRSRSAFSFLHFIGAALLYLACCLIAELINLSFDRYGTINMFYINPHYQMQQIIFRNLIPVLGNTGSILFYIAASVFGAFLLFLIWKAIRLCLYRICRR